MIAALAKAGEAFAMPEYVGTKKEQAKRMQVHFLPDMNLHPWSVCIRRGVF
jgi:hypothetical protein